MKNKKLIITGTSGFIGYFFLERALKKNYQIVDILRDKNKNNKKLNHLRKEYNGLYQTIFYKNLSSLEKKLKGKSFDCFINFATLYKNNHNHSEIPKFIESNLVFPTIILDIISKKINKIINIGTMMQHVDGKTHSPKNFYASTKSALEMILNFYTLNNKNLKYFNLKFYESFSEADRRKKLIPTMIKNYKKKLTTKIIAKNLELNIIHVKDILKAIFLLIKTNVSSGTYCLMHKRNIKIKNIIKKIKKKGVRTFKIKYINHKFQVPKKTYIKLLPKWKPDNEIENKIISEILK